ncbi:unnamed protein product [Pleuronectes platessa]|uniref:Uncharacterized protein n=1 Tax=Pleuronectes platessa TaxID=8262 RepID=A0A9N7YEY0_PLEPL|nr:unnamed protein product [Pleuronectes platessa]
MKKRSRTRWKHEEIPDLLVMRADSGSALAALQAPPLAWMFLTCSCLNESDPDDLQSFKKSLILEPGRAATRGIVNNCPPLSLNCPPLSSLCPLLELSSSLLPVSSLLELSSSLLPQLSSSSSSSSLLFLLLLPPPPPPPPPLSVSITSAQTSASPLPPRSETQHRAGDRGGEINDLELQNTSSSPLWAWPVDGELVDVVNLKPAA